MQLDSSNPREISHRGLQQVKLVLAPSTVSPGEKPDYLAMVQAVGDVAMGEEGSALDTASQVWGLLIEGVKMVRAELASEDAKDSASTAYIVQEGRSDEAIARGDTYFDATYRCDAACDTEDERGSYIVSNLNVVALKADTYNIFVYAGWCRRMRLPVVGALGSSVCCLLLGSGLRSSECVQDTPFHPSAAHGQAV